MSETRSQSRFEDARATARKVWTDVQAFGVRTRAEAAKVTARGRERWTAIATRARESSERTRGKVRTAWREQVEGAKAGLARVKAALGRA